MKKFFCLTAAVLIMFLSAAHVAVIAESTTETAGNQYAEKAEDDSAGESTNRTDVKINEKSDKTAEPEPSGKQDVIVDEKGSGTLELEPTKSPDYKEDGTPYLSQEDESVILVDLNSGAVVYQSREEEKRYPASTTKIMTALLVYEAVDRGEISLSDEVTVTADMIENLPADGTSISLKEGEVISVQHLMQGLLVASGNDAAKALAKYVCGSEEAFVSRMNERAAELGCLNTHFVNPHGLHDDEHFTTALDLARIAKEAMKHEEFRDTVDIAHIKIPPTNLSGQRYYINTNGLLSTMRYLEYRYEGATGIKTGTTLQAESCLVSSAKRGSMELIGVVLHAKDAAGVHKDSIKLLDYGFNNFTNITACRKGEMRGEAKVKQGARGINYVTLSTADETVVVVPKGVSSGDIEYSYDIPEAVYAPIKQGDKIGTLTLSYNGRQLTSVDLVADADISRHPLGFLMSVGERLWGIKFFRLIVYVIIAVVIVMIIIIIVGIRNSIKRAKMIKKQRKRR